MPRFIDVHVHPPVGGFLRAFQPFLPHLEAYFGRTIEEMSGEELADHYRERDGVAVLLAWDAETATHRPPLTNQEVALLVDEHPDVFVGFGSVDPNKGAKAVAGVHEAARLGLRGLKFHPSAQGFSLTDRQVNPVWGAAAEHGLICLVHTGFTALGAGAPGGMGVELEPARPMGLDRVAAEFPELTLIAAHPAWPWIDEQIALARHKPNVYLDLSGWSPKYFGEALMEAVAGPLADRTLFGSDFPFLTPDKWLRDWEGLGVEEELSRKVLVENAARLLGREA